MCLELDFEWSVKVSLVRNKRLKDQIPLFYFTEIVVLGLQMIW
jgi:hypothetical protein